VHAQPEADGQPGAGELLDDLQVHLVRLAAAAQPLRVRQAEQACGAERAEQLTGEDAIALSRGGSRPQFLVRQLRREPEELPGQVVGIDALRQAHQASTTTSSRVPLFSRMQPSSPQTTMSSILAPCPPG
jgi:hypothetical protein